MKLVLMGTNDWVVPVFDRIAREHEIVGVFTRAPKPAGRKLELQKSPVHVWAESKHIGVFTSIKDFASIVHCPSSIDYVVVASYGVILPDDVLASAPFVNIHPSLLPKYRGPSPMLSAIMNGDTKTGVCLMNVVSQLDAGDIYMCREIEIGEDDTNADLERAVSALSSDMLSEFLACPAKFPPHPQVGDITHSHKFKKEDLNIDWNNTAAQIHNQVRSIGGRTKINSIDVKILATKVVDGKLEIITVQPAGKNPMDWKSFVNGQRGEIKIGEGKKPQRKNKNVRNV